MCENNVNWVFWEDSDKSKETISKLKIAIDSTMEAMPLPVRMGIKAARYVDENVKIEKAPIFNKVYEKGKYEGKKEGYGEASFEYEKMLLNQAEEFLNQKNDFNKTRNEYEQLIKDYEIYIKKMEQKYVLSTHEEEYLNKIKNMEDKLKNLASLK